DGGEVDLLDDEERLPRRVRVRQEGFLSAHVKVAQVALKAEGAFEEAQPFVDRLDPKVVPSVLERRRDEVAFHFLVLVVGETEARFDRVDALDRVDETARQVDGRGVEIDRDRGLLRTGLEISVVMAVAAFELVE